MTNNTAGVAREATASDHMDHGSLSFQFAGGETATGTSLGTANPKNAKKIDPRAREKRQFKALVCLYVVAGLLVAMFAIFCVTWPLKAACASCVSDLMLEVGYWMCYAFSSVNPIVLLIFHEHFSKRFRKSLFMLGKKLFT